MATTIRLRKGSRSQAPRQKDLRAYLLTCIWFKKEIGRERYREYLEHASPIAEIYGARRVDALIPVETISGSFEPDFVFLVAWPSMEHYYKFLKDVHYRAVAPLLSEAVEKSVVLHCRRPG
ncbi:MAG: DUF1330 domain-containing protein [Candidatus Hydrogenedentes bacterium]|nr:DUF1330 domain-containing protein [Candidatus Hydrogenedentota bacterium]